LIFFESQLSQLDARFSLDEGGRRPGSWLSNGPKFSPCPRALGADVLPLQARLRTRHCLVQPFWKHALVSLPMEVDGAAGSRSFVRFRRLRSHLIHPAALERIARVRQAAEALFTPKSPRVRRSNSLPVLGGGPSPDPPHAEEVAKAAAMPEGTAAPPIDTPPPSARLTIPASQVARIRIWMKHGMTVSLVSEVFGVPISEVERVLRQAGRG
jgi:hypothetical protein